MPRPKPSIFRCDICQQEFESYEKRRAHLNIHRKMEQVIKNIFLVHPQDIHKLRELYGNIGLEPLKLELQIKLSENKALVKTVKSIYIYNLSNIILTFL